MKEQRTNKKHTNSRLQRPTPALNMEPSCCAGVDHRTKPNLTSNKTVNAVVTWPKWTERWWMCTSLQEIKKIYFPICETLRCKPSTCCTTYVRYPSPALREYRVDRQTGQMERRSVPQGAPTTLRTVVCGYGVPLRFQKNRFYSSE